MEIIIKDKHGKPIVEGQLFKFKYLIDLHEDPIELIGTFAWNQDELRYEIDIEDNEYCYIVLSYVQEVMKDFEII